MKKITVYETEDGARFETQEDAERHEKLSFLRKKYEDNNVLLSDYGETVSFIELFQWLHNNRNFVSALLSIKP